MEEKRENTEVTAKVVRGVPFQKGEDPRRNLDGRPKGALDFKTKWEIFIDKVAKSNNLTPQEIDEQLFAVGFKKAKEGDYAFYRDLHDRLYGKPVQHTELTGKDGKDLIPEPLSEEDKQKLNTLLNK